MTKKDYLRIVEDLNKENIVAEEKHPILNAIIIIVLGSFIAWLVIMASTQ